MPKEFWDEAVDCVVYLSNRCLTKELNGMTPQEAWNGRKQCYSLEGFLEHWLCACRWSSKDQARWQLLGGHISGGGFGMISCEFGLATDMC